MIFGHPGETESDYFQTIAFMKRIAPHVDTFLLNTLGLFGESAISRDLAGYGIDPGSADAMQWTGDSGANTYEVRRNRFLNALTLFRDKAADIGGFGDGAIEGDPVRPLRERIQAIPGAGRGRDPGGCGVRCVHAPRAACPWAHRFFGSHRAAG